MELIAPLGMGMVWGKSSGVLVPEPTAGLSRGNTSVTMLRSLSSSTRPRRKGAIGLDVWGPQESSKVRLDGVNGLDAKLPSSDAEMSLLVSAMENKLNGSSVRPNN
jgi:hypothetical protein